MARKNVFSKFAGPTNFVNMGLAIASVLLCLSFAMNGREISGDALVHPALSFGVSALISIFAVHSSRRDVPGFSLVRDVLPLFSFALAHLASGVYKTWVWVFLVTAVIAGLALFVVRKHGDYDDEDDKILIRPRWPF